MKQTMSANEVRDILFACEVKLITPAFLVKYSDFFDQLCGHNISAEYQDIDLLKKFYHALSKKMGLNRNPDKLYEETPCILLYNFYVRINLLRAHFEKVNRSIQVPSSTTSELFFYLIYEYYNAHVHHPSYILPGELGGLPH